MYSAFISSHNLAKSLPLHGPLFSGVVNNSFNSLKSSPHICRCICLSVKHTVCSYYMGERFHSYFRPVMDWALSEQSPMQSSQFISFLCKKWLIILNTSSDIALPSVGLQSRT
jgi:hypothetical protein